jgi:Skp family chaperone for outer membrane proteins
MRAKALMSVLAALAMILAFGACAPEPYEEEGVVGGEGMEMEVDERSEAYEELDARYADLDREMEEWEAEWEQAGQELDAETEEEWRELQAQRDELRTQLDQFEQASEEEWQELERNTNEAMNDFEQGWNDFLNAMKADVEEQG